MIPERIQRLYREAVFKTCVQGTRAGYLLGDVFTCAYTDNAGRHCAVGHALTPEMQERNLFGGVWGLCSNHPYIAEHLGIDPAKLNGHYADKAGQDTVIHLWECLQAVHDRLLDEPSRAVAYKNYLRPWGVSWSAYFWYRARSNAADFGFDIGNYPRREVQDAQAA